MDQVPNPRESISISTISGTLSEWHCQEACIETDACDIFSWGYIDTNSKDEMLVYLLADLSRTFLAEGDCLLQSRRSYETVNMVLNSTFITGVANCNTSEAILGGRML